VHRRRVAAGGNKKEKYEEGWVEFLDKKVAKFVVATLHNQPMGACRAGRQRRAALRLVSSLSLSLARAGHSTFRRTPTPGDNKRTFYGSDLWVLKYLSGFRWHHLTEKVAYEGRIRSQKLRAELAGAKKEAEHYLGQVELAHKMEKKGRLPGAAAAAAAAAAARGAASEAAAPPKLEQPRRSFKQRQPLVAHDGGGGGGGGGGAER